MSSIQRVKKIIDTYQTNIYTFERNIEVSNNSIQIAIKRNAPLKDIVLNKILNYYEDINPEWLLTGKGTMLRTGAPDSPQTQGVRGGELPALELEIETLKKEIARLSELLEAKNEIIELLRGRR